MERGVTPVRKRETLWLDLGKAGYEPTYRLQLELAERRRAGDIPDVAMVVEHEPCITLGRAARAEHVLVDPEVLESAGVGVHRVDRGGDVTYHGWGQLVCYAIVDLSAYGRDVHAHARRLEEVMIRTVAAFGVSAHRVPAYPGVWCRQGKLGAIGFGVRRWVTTHGASLNVSPHMPHYDLIVPCGIHGGQVTSLERVAGRSIGLDRVRSELKQAYGTVFGARLTTLEDEGAGLLGAAGAGLGAGSRNRSRQSETAVGERKGSVGMALKVMLAPGRYVQGPGALDHMGEQLEILGIGNPLDPGFPKREEGGWVGHHREPGGEGSCLCLHGLRR